jgi:hypothetical protein
MRPNETSTPSFLVAVDARFQAKHHVGYSGLRRGMQAGRNAPALLAPIRVRIPLTNFSFDERQTSVVRGSKFLKALVVQRGLEMLVDIINSGPVVV